MLTHPVRLDVGCGDVCEPGWIGVDPCYYGVDVVAPADDLPYGDGTVDAIRCSHCLEHIPAADLPAVMAEWRRVLRPGGTVTIAVPDSLYVAQGCLDQGACDGWIAVALFGLDRWPGDRHVTAFALDTVADLVVCGGFRIDRLVREWSELHQQVSIVCEAHKP